MKTNERNERNFRNAAAHGVRTTRSEVQHFGFNARPDGYDRLISVGTFHVDKLPAIGADMATHTVKTPSGERLRLRNEKTVDTAIRLKATLAGSAALAYQGESALVTWRVVHHGSQA